MSPVGRPFHPPPPAFSNSVVRPRRQPRGDSCAHTGEHQAAGKVPLPALLQEEPV